MMWRLTFPLTSPALVTVAICLGFKVWNGVRFPLILTKSPDKRTMPLWLLVFQGEHTVNIPAVLAAVIIFTVPILVLYPAGRLQPLSGLTAGVGQMGRQSHDTVRRCGS
jgi:raffinose/stachyose/melibiose transport system permease protein